MKIAIRFLAVIAVIQVALIAFTWSGKTDLKSHSGSSTLLTFSQTDVDAILIEDKENKILITKKDDKWLLPDGFPADGNKVKNLLEKLAGLQYGLPVATSKQSLSRFRVAENEFSRHLQLKSGEKILAELYLGTGAGARQSHLRSGNQDSVYTAAIGSYDLPFKYDEWQDKKILQFKAAEVSSLELGDIKLDRETGAAEKEPPSPWQSKSLPPDTVINQHEINQGMEKLANLQFSKTLKQEEVENCDLSKPALTIKIRYADNERTYLFAEINDSEDICLKVSDKTEYFQLASYLAKPILEHFSEEKILTTNTSTADSETVKKEE